MTDLSMFIPLTKVDEEKRLVYGIATAETPDRAGEICDYASTVPHYKAWSGEFEKITDGKSMGNIRAMHGKVAVGKAVSIDYDDENKRIMLCAKIIDDNEWQKVVNGVYTGFSQGGSYVKRWEDPTDSTKKRYTAKPTEISLVDMPCLPTATFEYIKAHGETEMRKFQEVDDITEDQVDLIDATEMFSVLKTGVPDHWIDFVDDAADALTKYSDKQQRDGNGRWAAIGSAVVAAAGGAAGGALTGGMIGGVHGALAGAVVGAVTQAHRSVTQDPSSRTARASSFLGGAIVGIPAGVIGGAAGALTTGAGKAVAAFAKPHMDAATAAGKQARAATVNEINTADAAFHSTPEAQRKAAEDLFQNWYSSRYKKMDGVDLDLRKSVWDELGSIHTCTKFVFVTADMVKSLDPTLTDDNAVDLVLDELEKYSDSESRDSKGEWTSGSGIVGRTVRGAIAGATSSAIGAIPGAALATIAGGPAAGAAFALKEVATGAIVGGATGTVSSSKNVESNAKTAVQAVGMAQSAVSGYRAVRSFVGDPASRAKTIQSVRDAISAVPKTIRAAQSVGRAAVSVLTAADSAVGRASQGIVDGIASVASKTTRYGKIDQVAGHLIELEKMGVNIAEIVSAIQEEDSMSDITNQQICDQAEKMAKDAADGSVWSSHITAAREALEKAAPDATLTPPLEVIRPVFEKVDAPVVSPLEAALAKVDAIVNPVVLTDAQLARVELKKYMGEEVYDAQSAMSALSAIMSIYRGEVGEKEINDGQCADLETAIDKIKSFIASEIMEDNSPDMMQMSARMGDLAKSGARNSASDKTHLNAIHDHCVSLGCDCGAEKTVVTDDLAKALKYDALVESMEKMVPRVEAMGELLKSQSEELAALKAQPVPPPVLRVMNKGGDVVFAKDEAPVTEINDAFKKLTPEQQADIMIKIAQQNPLSVINRG